MLFITHVIPNIDDKIFQFPYSVTYCSQALRRPVHRARKTLPNGTKWKLKSYRLVSSVLQALNI